MFVVHSHCCYCVAGTDEFEKVFFAMYWKCLSTGNGEAIVIVCMTAFKQAVLKKNTVQKVRYGHCEKQDRIRNSI